MFIGDTSLVNSSCLEHFIVMLIGALAKYDVVIEYMFGQFRLETVS
jgi:hypothetical protein